MTGVVRSVEVRGATPAEQEAVPPAELTDLLARVPAGWTQVSYGGTAWGLTRTDRARGGATTLYAEQLGGPGVVSANVWHTRGGDVLRPCEMPAQDVLAFLRGWTPRAGPGPDR